MDHLVAGHFREVLDDADRRRSGPAASCSARGKVYYDLLAKRERGRQAAGRRHRPHRAALSLAGRRSCKQVLDRYRTAREWVWVQEESQNMGAWTFVAPRLHELMGFPFQYVGRDASASPATGSKLVHDREQAELVEAAIGAAVPHLVTATPVRSLAAAVVQQGVR